MKAEEFVSKIKMLKPSKDDLNVLNTPEKFKNELISEYDISRLTDEQSFDVDDVLDLVLNYDVSRLRIGQIILGKGVMSDNNFFYIGEHEADKIVINKMNKKIQLIDHETGETLIDCASNGSAFLDALVVLKEFLLKCLLGKVPAFDQEEDNKIAFQCASLAGGELYLDYYKYLLGC